MRHIAFYVFLLLSIVFGVQSSSANNTAESRWRLLVLGDSLTAGYGLAANDAFPAQLERALRHAGYDVTVINAGVSGDTTAGGLSRLDWSLADHPQLVLVELGGNDALRGLPPSETRANLDGILRRLKQAGVKIILAGMQAPRNLGDQYTKAFNRVFPELAAKYQVSFYPFFLAGVALDPALNQADGIHPNPRGVAVIVSRILPTVEDALRSLH